MTPFKAMSIPILTLIIQGMILNKLESLRLIELIEKYDAPPSMLNEEKSRLLLIEEILNVANNVLAQKTFK